MSIKYKVHPFLSNNLIFQYSFSPVLVYMIYLWFFFNDWSKKVIENIITSMTENHLSDRVYCAHVSHIVLY